MAKKPNPFAAIKAGGAKKLPADLGAPAEIGAPRQVPAEAPAEAVPPADDEQPTQQADPEEVGFHDGTEVCANCTHFDAEGGNCERWGFSVGDHPEGAYCHGFKAGSDNEAAEGETGAQNGKAT